MGGPAGEGGGDVVGRPPEVGAERLLGVVDPVAPLVRAVGRPGNDVGKSRKLIDFAQLEAEQPEALAVDEGDEEALNARRAGRGSG